MDVVGFVVILLFIQIKTSVLSNPRQTKNKSSNVNYTIVNTSSSSGEPSSSQKPSTFTKLAFELINRIRNNKYIGKICPCLLPKRYIYLEKECKEVFGINWTPPPALIGDFFHQNDYSSCLRNNDDNGNCLFYSLAFFLRIVHRNGVTSIPNPEYKVHENLINKIKRIMENKCGKITIQCVRALAAIDFIGVDFDNEEDLATFDYESLIDKLELYGQAYAGRSQDKIDVSRVIREIRKDPTSKIGYERLYNDLSRTRNPPHWGNESDIASLERIFNFKAIIFNDQGSAFSIPSGVNNPFNVFVLYFANLHYNPISFYQVFEACGKSIQKKVYYFTSEDVPDFLLQYLQTNSSTS